MKSFRLIMTVELLARARASLILAAALLATSAGWAQTIYVDVNTGDDGRTGEGDWTNAVATISNGVALAGAGGPVLVATGRYEVAVNISITAGITLRSWNNGELDPTNTVVDGQGVARCLYMSHADAMVAGFTFTNGNGVSSTHNGYGGGVYLRRGTISNCIVSGNSADERGGGIYNDNENNYSLIIDCTIAGNIQTNTGVTALMGGGGVYIRSWGTLRNSRVLNNEAKSLTLYCGGGGVLWTTVGNSVMEISGCTIAFNTAYMSGGGVSLSSRAPSGAVFRNNEIYGNAIVGSASSRRGGGVAISEPYLGFVIDSCRIVSNTCNNFGSGISITDGGKTGELGLTITNCTIGYNSGSCAAIERQWGGGVAATNSIYDYRIINSTLEYNTNTTVNGYGGAVSFFYTGIWIEGCRIRGNRADIYGGVYFEGPNKNPESPSVLRNCLITENKSAIYCLNIIKNGWIDNCTIVSNTASGATGGLVVDGGAVSNTICYYNTGSTHPDWSGSGTMGYNCFSTNDFGTYPTIITNAPLFSDSDHRLSSQSPCVNAGANQDWMNIAVDLDGHPRLDRFIWLVDMGAYEFQPSGCLISTY